MRDADSGDFVEVEGPPYTLPNGYVHVRRYSLGLELLVALTESSSFFQCRRSSASACAVTTCTWPPKGSPGWNNTGLVKLSYGAESEDVPTGGDVTRYGLWPNVAWETGQEILLTGVFEIGPSFAEKLVGPPELTLEQPLFEKSEWGPDMPLPIEVETAGQLKIQWLAEPTGTVRATLACDNVETGQSSQIQCLEPASSGTLAIPPEALRYLPTTGFGCSISISIGDFRELVLPSWTYDLSVANTARSPAGADANAKLIPK